MLKEQIGKHMNNSSIKAKRTCKSSRTSPIKCTNMGKHGIGGHDEIYKLYKFCTTNFDNSNRVVMEVHGQILTMQNLQTLKPSGHIDNMIHVIEQMYIRKGKAPTWTMKEYSIFYPNTIIPEQQLLSYEFMQRFQHLLLMLEPKSISVIGEIKVTKEDLQFNQTFMIVDCLF